MNTLLSMYIEEYYDMIYTLSLWTTPIIYKVYFHATENLKLCRFYQYFFNFIKM